MPCSALVLSYALLCSSSLMCFALSQHHAAFALVIILFPAYRLLMYKQDSSLTKYSFVAKVWRNVRGQYQFKTAEVTSNLSAAMFFGRIDLYSVHWVHEANRNLASSRCYSDVAIVHHSRFCKANRNMVPGSPARPKIRDVTQWSLYYPKAWRRLSLTSLPPFWIDIDREHSFTLATKLSYLFIQFLHPSTRVAAVSNNEESITIL